MIVLFFAIFNAPFDKLDDNITGNNNGVIHIATATANVNANIVSCFHAFMKNTIGINISMNFINILLILSIPF